MKYLSISLGIFFVLAASRFIPHPPNFTSLIALSFYVPALMGTRFIPFLLISFIITDIIIGIHSTILFTWGSIILIGLISNYLKRNIYFRFSGVLFSCIIFFIISNLGVWLTGSYGYHINGLIACYTLALPFFGNTIVATVIYSIVIEAIYKFFIDKRLFSEIR